MYQNRRIDKIIQVKNILCRLCVGVSVCVRRLPVRNRQFRWEIKSRNMYKTMYGAHDVHMHVILAC